MTPTILITRPQPMAAQLATKLTELGYTSVVVPLLRLQPTYQPVPDFSAYRLLIITSGNAFSFLDPAALAALQKIPCLCVGAVTAEAARAAGFANVQTAGGTGAALADYVLRHYPVQDTPILHLCGRDITPNVQQQLIRAGYRLDSWVLYDAEKVVGGAPALHDFLRAANAGVALFYSARTAATFRELVHRHDLTARLVPLAAIVLSPAIAAALEPWPGDNLWIAPSPTEAALIACLRENYPAL